MPWSQKQLNLFRAAAHNPAISKSSGIKQSDAERMSKEGLKKAAGGMLKQRINHPDTKHGLLDLPVANLKKYQGMAEGGSVSKEFEGSAKDEAQDKKLAKKHGMSFNQWEKSKMDVKHDKQESMAGLKKGGRAKGYCKGGGIEQRGHTKGRVI